MSRLEKKVALVTGGARGIGAAIAAKYEAEGAIVYRGDILPVAGPRGLALDVTSRPSIAAAMERIGRDHGGLDILVNNAGLISTTPADRTPGEEWDRLLAVNLTGIFNCIQAALPLMAGRPGACIVNMASVSSEKGGGAIGNVWYGTTKAGVVALTRGLGRELGPKGIRINAISPAVVDTDMTHALIATGLGGKAVARIPLGRLAEKADVAQAALFLASPEAAFITGETLAVDGGFLRT
jgi:3-oxoacyl-[acyl-carrier protein] reductase